MYIYINNNTGAFTTACSIICSFHPPRVIYFFCFSFFFYAENEVSEARAAAAAKNAAIARICYHHHHRGAFDRRLLVADRIMCVYFAPRRTSFVTRRPDGLPKSRGANKNAVFLPASVIIIARNVVASACKTGCRCQKKRKFKQIKQTKTSTGRSGRERLGVWRIGVDERPTGTDDGPKKKILF